MAKSIASPISFGSFIGLQIGRVLPERIIFSKFDV